MLLYSMSGCIFYSQKDFSMDDAAVREAICRMFEILTQELTLEMKAATQEVRQTLEDLNHEVSGWQQRQERANRHTVRAMDDLADAFYAMPQVQSSPPSLPLASIYSYAIWPPW
jgi:hypothetical protein